MASIINAATSGGLITTADTSGILQLQTAGTTAVTVDASQNVTFANSARLPNTFGFKNRIINGAMVIDQRNVAASQTYTAAGALAYSVDRWYGFCTGANVTGQQVAGSTSPSNTQFRYRFTGAASVTAVGFGQRIEQKNSYDLAGSTATLSADLAISATLTTVTWTASYATTTADTFGTLASPTITQIATGTFTVTSTVTNFSTNITVPSAATTGIQIVFTVGALTAGLTWTIGNVQLEKGSTATSFDVRDFGRELIMCQRYFEKSYDITTAIATSTADGLTYAGVGSGLVPNNYGFMTLVFTITKRSSPTMKIYSRSGTLNQVSNGDQNDYGTVNAQNIGMRSAIVVNGTGSNLSPSAGMTCAHFTADSEL